MSILPATGVLGDLGAGHLASEFADEIEDLRAVVAEMPGAVAATTLTISAGGIVPPVGAGGGWHLVDTEGAGAADDLTTGTLTNSHVGRRLRVACVNAARVVTVKNAAGGSGQFLTYDAADFILDALDKWIEFRLVGTDWSEIARSYGVDRAKARLNIGVPKQISHNTLCPHRGLSVTSTTSDTVDWVAAELVLEDASGNQQRITSFSKRTTITLAGALGLDTGSEAPSTWYHAWAIAKADGTQSVILSLSTTVAGLTFPAGYTYAGLIGAVRNDSSSNQLEFRQLGDEVQIDSVSVLAAGTATSSTSLASTLATVVPPTARKAFGYGRVSDSSSAAAALTLRPLTGVTNTGVVVINNPGGSTGKSGGYFEMALPTPQTIFYQVSTGDAADIVVVGWKF